MFSIADEFDAHFPGNALFLRMRVQVCEHYQRLAP